MAKRPPTNEVARVDDPEESRPLQAYRLKMAGHSLAEIAEELGYASPQAVLSAINNETHRLVGMAATVERADLLQLQNDRYGYLLSKVWPQVEFGDLAAINAARALLGDITKLNQLDAVDASSHTTQVLVIGGHETEYIEKLKRLAED